MAGDEAECVKVYSMQAAPEMQASRTMNVRSLLRCLRTPTGTEVAALAVAIIAALAALAEFWRWLGNP